MKFTRHTFLTLIFSATLIFPALTVAGENFWDQARQATHEGLEATRKGIEEAAKWGREKSVEAWDATKEGAAEASAWSKEKVDEVLDAARKGSAEILETLKGKDEKAAGESQRDSRIF